MPRQHAPRCATTGVADHTEKCYAREWNADLVRKYVALASENSLATMVAAHRLGVRADAYQLAAELGLARTNGIAPRLREIAREARRVGELLPKPLFSFGPIKRRHFRFDPLFFEGYVVVVLR